MVQISILKPIQIQLRVIILKKYDVAAYVWPAYTGDEGRSLIFWPEGYGEWETVKAAKAQFDGHKWPRKPLWGYCNEADPYVMEMQIEAAVDHGVNVFIYDWYWYDNRPFLEQCLNNGFLKAKNRSKMKFYLMWANHNVTYGWDRRISEKDFDTVIWKGAVNSEQFHTIGMRWLEKYFCLDEYYKIDNRPVLSIYDLQNLIDGLGGIENARKELLWLDEEAKKQGFNGMHYQLVKYGRVKTNLSGFDGNEKTYKPHELVGYLPFSSLTHYQFVHFSKMNDDYKNIMEQVRTEWQECEDNFNIPYIPHVSIGWDNTPRYACHIHNVVKNNTPQAFEDALRQAKELADKTGVNMITINSWNEWTETSYLQPDDIYGYGYLDAVKRVFKESD